MAFDGIVTKAICSELQQFRFARIDKIFQTSKNNIIIGFYHNNSNYALNICIDPQYYRISLTTHQKENPKNESIIHHELRISHISPRLVIDIFSPLK